MSRTHRGFTLIELLVVITIILVLAGMLFMFAKRGREAAYATKCMNNIKQIATSHITLTQDNNGDFIHPNGTKMYGRKRGWAMHFTAGLHADVDVKKWDKVNDRVVTLEMLNCPAAYAEHKVEMADHNGHARWRTYGLNTRIGRADGQYNAGGGDSNNGHVTGATRPDQVENPTKLILVSEAGWNGRAYRNAFGPHSTKDNGMGAHHGDGFHVGYMDGHVEKHTEATFPADDVKLPNGLVMNYRDATARNEGEIQAQLVWRGSRVKRTIPNSPPPQ